ncbi:MAG TPA: polyhydroxyalkanoate depolymerase [Burkholderiaceae bacterium]|nr:polyhydroxyalkanoate depolymerase [Burkholderiaceae bacterium]
MLYQIREGQRAILNPLSDWAEAMSKLYANPYSLMSYVPFSNRIAAGFELMHRLGKEYEKPAFGLGTTTVQGQQVSVVERIELSKPFCRLLKFERLLPNALAARAADPTVLLVAPLSGHHATLLRDTVRALLPDHNVYITDWVDARMVPLAEGPFHLDDYVAYCIEFIRHLGPQVHVISVCQPTVPVLAAVSVMATLKDPKLPLTMTMMGGPIDTRSSPTQVNNLATNHSYEWFEHNVIHTVPMKYPGGGRRVYPGFLQHAGFVAMNPDRHVNSHWDFYLDLTRGDLDDAEAHRKFYDEYNAVLDLPAQYYLDTIRIVFKEHQLPLGNWHVQFEGQRIKVQPANIRNVALFTIEGELDDISGSGQTEAAHGLCSNIPREHQQHLTAKDCGHYGIFSGRRWREYIYPQIRDFIRAHEQRIGLRRVK